MKTSGQPQERFPFGETGRGEAPPARLPVPVDVLLFLPDVDAGFLLVRFPDACPVILIT